MSILAMGLLPFAIVSGLLLLSSAISIGIHHNVRLTRSATLEVITEISLVCAFVYSVTGVG